MTGIPRAVRRRYAGARLVDRAHVWLRASTCPFDAVLAALPPGDVLDIGCGQGLLSTATAMARPDRRVRGVDVDGQKLAVAERSRAQPPALRGLSFEAVSTSWKPAGSYDAVVVVDVLYLMPEARQERVITAAATTVRPGGRLVVKEMALRPRWKLALVRAQETVSVRLLKVTSGGDHGFSFVPPERIVRWMSDAGLTVTGRRCDRWYPWPHHLVIGDRPPARGRGTR